MKYKEHNGVYGGWASWHKKTQEDNNTDDIETYKNYIWGFIYGMYGAHFINKTEYEQLIYELYGFKI